MEGTRWFWNRRALRRDEGGREIRFWKRVPDRYGRVPDHFGVEGSYDGMRGGREIRFWEEGTRSFWEGTRSFWGRRVLRRDEGGVERYVF